MRIATATTRLVEALTPTATADQIRFMSVAPPGCGILSIDSVAARIQTATGGKYRPTSAEVRAANIPSISMGAALTRIATEDPNRSTSAEVIEAPKGFTDHMGGNTGWTNTGGVPIQVVIVALMALTSVDSAR